MSEFHVQVVKIDNIERHFNADTLSVSLIHGGYPVIFRTGEFKLGDLAVYIPIDAKDTRTQTYLNYDDFVNLMKELELPMAPVLYRGIWKDDLRSLANGVSTIPNANHIREGFVAKPVKERWDQRIGRVILKLIGEDYLLR